jgi:hypothetical protein
MKTLLSVGIAIAATVWLLLLREFVLSAGKKGRNPFSRRSGGTGSASEDRLRPRLRAVPNRRSEQPSSDATPIAVDEFFTELRAKAEENQSPSRKPSGSESEFAADTHHRTVLAGRSRYYGTRAAKPAIEHGSRLRRLQE